MVAKPNMDIKTAFNTLGIDPTSSVGDIKRAYRKKAFDTHPDRNNSDTRYNKLFNDVKDAYDILTEYSDNLIDSSFVNATSINGLDMLIAAMSHTEKRLRFNADIEAHYNDVNTKYVLLKGIGHISKDWGFILLAYKLPFHKDIVNSYIRDTNINTRTLEILGGGRLDIKWLVPNSGPTISTYGMSGDYGPPKSLLAVRTCLDNFIHDYYGWATNSIKWDIQ